MRTLWFYNDPHRRLVTQNEEGNKVPLKTGRMPIPILDCKGKKKIFIVQIFLEFFMLNFLYHYFSFSFYAHYNFQQS